jgi:hypothetical protein
MDEGAHTVSQIPDKNPRSLRSTNIEIQVVWVAKMAVQKGGVHPGPPKSQR